MTVLWVIFSEDGRPPNGCARSQWTTYPERPGLTRQPLAWEMRMNETGDVAARCEPSPLLAVVLRHDGGGRWIVSHVKVGPLSAGVHSGHVPQGVQAELNEKMGDLRELVYGEEKHG